MAWIRTGIALIAVGLAAAQFLAHGTLSGLRLVTIMSLLTVLSGVLVTIMGARRYLNASKQIEEGHLLPVRYSVVLITVLIIVIGLLALVFVYLVRV